LLQAWLEQACDDLEAMQQLMDLLQAGGDHRGVAEWCARAMRFSEGQDQVPFALRLSESCERAGAPQDAREELEAVYAAHRDSAELRAHLKRIYDAVGAHEQLAELLLDEARECVDDTSRGAMLKRAGESYLNAGQAGLALAPLREALALDSSDFGLLTRVVDACMNAEQLQDANELLDQGLEAPGCKRGVRALLSQRKAWLARAAGDRRIELSWLEEAFKHDRGNGQIALELADLAELLEQWETADQALRGIAMMKDDAPISRGESFLRQSRLWLLRGDAKRALAWARKAKQEEPESEQVEAMLQQLNEQ
jgi:thioredoxin-like negative regulator of GroEL